MSKSVRAITTSITLEFADDSRLTIHEHDEAGGTICFSRQYVLDRTRGLLRNLEARLFPFVSKTMSYGESPKPQSFIHQARTHWHKLPPLTREQIMAAEAGIRFSKEPEQPPQTGTQSGRFKCGA